MTNVSAEAPALDELIKKLIDWDEYDEGKNNDARAAAAAELTRLTAENERLTTENARLGQWDVAADERIQLIKENERLRAALEWYADKVEKCRNLLDVGDAARNALDADGGQRARDALKEPRT